MDLTDFLLTNVQRKPGLYLFQNKLLYLYIFVSGYSFGIHNSDRMTDRFLNNFSTWFIGKKNSRKDSMWYPSILEECNGSEEKALEKFFNYLKQFDIETKNRS